MHTGQRPGCVLHMILHSSRANRKMLKGNQIIVLTEFSYGRILQEQGNLHTLRIVRGRGGEPTGRRRFEIGKIAE